MAGAQLGIATLPWPETLSGIGSAFPRESAVGEGPPVELEGAGWYQTLSCFCRGEGITQRH